MTTPPSKPFGLIEAIGAGGTVTTKTATPMYERLVTLKAGVETTFETRDLSEGSDPVLHLLTPGGLEYRVSDDADEDGTKDARITVRPTVSGTYRLVVHAFTTGTAGTARIFQDGNAITSTVPVGGLRVLVAGIRRGETLETVRRPGDHLARPVFYIFEPGGRRIWRRVVGGGTAGGLRWSFPFAAGSRHVLFAVRARGAGPMTIVRNDSGIDGHDPDHDGLGSELEARIATCSRRSGVVGGFDCAKARDARDTDGDGVRDDWEILGRRDRQPHQALPLWGADPRHKDIFVETDFMHNCGDAANADRRMSPDVARQMAAFYADRVGPEVSAGRRAARAADLNNPDGRPGVSLHLDTGVAGAAGETTFGDWGGHSVVGPVTDANGRCVRGAKAETAWPLMARARRGIFHYSLGYFSGGGQAAEWRAYAAFNAGDALNSAHEFGHSVGLGHSGRAGAAFADPNCKPTYPSIMNYGYYDHWSTTSDVGFADGRDRATLVNGSLTEIGAVNPADHWYVNHLRTIFQYNVDDLTGNVDWNRNGMYESLTTQAYTNYAGGGAGCEWTKYNPVPVAATTTRSPSLVRVGTYMYVFYARGADGRLAFARTASHLRCRRPVEDTPCDGAHFGGHGTRGVDASRGVVAVRLRFGSADRLLVVAVGADGRVRETRLSVDAHGDESWSSVRTITGDAATGEPALERVGTTTAYLAFAGIDRRVRYRRFSTATGWSVRALAQSAATPAGTSTPLPALPAAASPALYWGYLPSQPATRALYGAFADAIGRLTLYRRDPQSGLWQETSDLDTRPTVTGRPALVWAPTYTHDERIGHLYLHYIDAKGIPRWMSTWTAGIGAAAVQRVGLDGPFQNIWLDNVSGLASMYEFGVDANLRVVVAGEDGKLILYPNADGVMNHEIADHNDWSVFRYSLCRTLMYPEGRGVDPLVEKPLDCGPAPPRRS